jgi:cation transport regulator ChaC
LTTWVFGYGSLVWRPAFPHAERVPAVLEGFERRFWQGSTDHRGVPGAPGRVVTLIEQAGARCAGVAYRVPDEQRDEVLRGLDHREKGGYERRTVALQTERGELPGALVYWAGPGNPNWLGEAPAAEIARQVHSSAGPSGPNDEYVVELCRALQRMDERDDHCFAILAELEQLRG